MAAKVRCPQCGKLVKSSLHYCDECGSDLSVLAETAPGTRRSGSLPFILGVVIALLVVAIVFIALLLTGTIQTAGRVTPSPITPVPEPTTAAATPEAPRDHSAGIIFNEGLTAGIAQAKATYEPQLAQQYQDGVNAGIQQAKNTYEPQITNYEQQLSEFEDLLSAVVEAYESPSDAIQDPTMVQTFPISATLSAEKSYIVSINSAAQIRYYSFTPVTTGYYTLYSSGAFNTRAALYRDDDLLAEDDDSGDRYNFKLTYYLRAERTYIFSVKMTSVAAEGSFSIRLIHGFN